MGFKTHLIVLSMAAILWCATVIDAFAVGKSKTTEAELEMQLATLQLHAAGLPANPDNLERAKRAIETAADKTVQLICRSMSCGWAVYDAASDPSMLSIKYFMRNTCSCPNNSFKCIRTKNDVSVSAYEYRCRQNTTDQDIKFPENATNSTVIF